MGKKDSLLKQLFKDNARCADILNFAVYGGKQVIKPGELRELDSAQVVSPYTGDAIVPRQKQRDILKAQVKPCVVSVTDNSKVYLIYGIENQSQIHYAMPVKGALYDAMLYDSQVKAIERMHRKDKQSRMNSGEYLSGFTKTDRLVPVITLVVYFGAEKWDGSRSLHEMFDILDKRILALIPDYKINLIVPAEMSEKDFLDMRSGLGAVLGFIKHSKDKAKLKKMVATNKHFESMDREEAEVIKAMTHAHVVIKPNKEGKVNMCKALVDIETEARTQGKAEGLVLSITNLMKSLKLPLEQAMDLLKVPAKERKVYAGLVTGKLKKQAK